MKKIQLLSVVLSLIMFTGMTTGSVVFAEYDKTRMTEKIDEFCELSSDAQTEKISEHPMMAQFTEQIAIYCNLETADERLVYLQEQMALYKKDHGMKNHGDMMKKINAYCDMTPEEQAEIATKHNKSEDKVAKMNEYCSLDEEGRAAFIEEYKAEYKHHKGDKKHKGDKTEKMNRYCEMTPDEQANLISKHNKSEDKVAKMNEYCSLDEEGRAAFIEEYKAEYKRHDNKMNKDSKKYMKHLTDEQKTVKKGIRADIKALKAEFQALKVELSEDDELTDEQKRDLRMQFIQKARQIQISWITPQN